MSTLETGAARIAAAVRTGSRSAVAVADAFLAPIERNNSVLNAFLHVDPEGVREEAARVDARVAAGADPGPLAGVPVAIKDNIVTRGLPTTAGSSILEGYLPDYDATVVERLRAAGAVVLGKTNLDAFAMGSSNENSDFGPVRNPWDPARVPGGSSGGSAAAVAGGLAPLGLGSDTGGSIRQPAAFCGAYGLKPTYGRVSRYGLIAFASSLDQIGGFSRDLESLELLYRAIAGPDPRDATSSSRPVVATPGAAGDSLRVGVARDLLEGTGVEPAIASAVRSAAEALERSGATLQPITLPDPDTGIAAYYVLATAEASSNLARYDGVRYGSRVEGESLDAMYRATRSRGFGTEVKRRILLGTYALSAGYYDAFYRQAQRVRADLRRTFERRFEEVDLILLPTTPTTAFPIGAKVDDPLAMYLADVFTVSANLSGIPGLSIPWGRDGAGLPIGVQLLAPAFREDRLFDGAARLDRLRPEPLTWPELPA